MTSRKSRPGQQMGILKAAVAAGSLAAAFMGTQLLAAQSGAELEQATAVTPEPIVINVPITLPTQPPPPVVPAEGQPAAVNPAGGGAAPQIGSGLVLNLEPIPQAVSPQIISPPPRPAAPPASAPAPRPVTQTKSSK